ncbi:MAG: hypothetical protein ACTSV2_14795 [Candidatus Thorarchaeota archaeon]
MMQKSIFSNDEFSETEPFRSSIYSNNVGDPNDAPRNKGLITVSEKCEEPVSFFLLDEGGLRIASIDFCRRERVDENLVAGFLSAIQAFSDQVFAQSVSQIKLDDYTLLMKAYSPFTFVYVFRDPVEPAEEKLNQIIRNLSEAPEEWSAIAETRYTGRVLSDDTRFSVESMVRLNLGMN